MQTYLTRVGRRGVASTNLLDLIDIIASCAPGDYEIKVMLTGVRPTTLTWGVAIKRDDGEVEIFRNPQNLQRSSATMVQRHPAKRPVHRWSYWARTAKAILGGLNDRWCWLLSLAKLFKEYSNPYGSSSEVRTLTLGNAQSGGHAPRVRARDTGGMWYNSSAECPQGKHG
jgi:hypothetical protein